MTPEERMRLALRMITKMGRVCPNFDLCTHVACADSCGAVLMALMGLNDSPTPEQQAEFDRLVAEYLKREEEADASRNHADGSSGS